MIEKLDNTGELEKSELLESVHFIFRYMVLITPSEITNCLKQAGFLNEKSTKENEFDIEDH